MINPKTFIYKGNIPKYGNYVVSTGCVIRIYYFNFISD